MLFPESASRPILAMTMPKISPGSRKDPILLRVLSTCKLSCDSSDSDSQPPRRQSDDDTATREDYANLQGESLLKKTLG